MDNKSHLKKPIILAIPVVIAATVGTLDVQANTEDPVALMEPKEETVVVVDQETPALA